MNRDRLPTAAERALRAMLREVVDEALEARGYPRIPLSEEERVALDALDRLRKLGTRPG